MSGFSRPRLEFEGTISGNVTAAGADQEVDFAPKIAGVMVFRFDTDASIKLNDESNYHDFKAGESQTSDALEIKKFFIKDAASIVRYSGGSIKVGA